MSEDYNQWRSKVQQWQAPLKKWAQSKEGREMFSKIVEEAPEKHVSPCGLTPQGALCICAHLLPERIQQRAFQLSATFALSPQTNAAIA